MDNPGFDHIELKDDRDSQSQKGVEDNGHTKPVSGDESQAAEAFHPEESYKERFGWGKVRPDCLQFLSTVQGMLVLLVIGAVVQSIAMSGMVGSTISTLEKRYQLPSSKSGLISTVYDVSYSVVTILLTYVITTRRGKIVSIGVGAFLLGLGLFTYSLSHFIVGMYDYGEAVSATCDPASNSTFTNCVEEERGLSEFLFVFLVAQFINAVGSISMYVFASDVVESSAPPNSGGFYLGILSAFRGTAGAAGFIINSQLLNIFVDFNKAGNIPPSGGVSDPRWLGAWWLGFPPLAVIAVCTAPWLLGLPGKISAKQKAAHAKNEQEKGPTQEPAGTLGVVDFFKQLWDLATNPTYLFMVLLGIGANMAYTGLQIFGVKYVENQFAMSAGAASLYAGLTVVPAGVLGAILGGFLMKKYKMGVTAQLKLTLVGVAAMFIIPFAFLIRCPNTLMAGVTVPYANGSVPQTPIVGADDVISPCDLGCPCPPAYNPVCGENGVEYFSPCLAGCYNISQEDQYTSCACHAGDQPMGAADGDMFSVTSGHCSNGCNLLPLALTFLFLFCFGFGMADAPRIVIVLSCVKENQRSFALGIQSVVRTFLGSVPAPLVYGALLDRACLLWDENCDQQGACLLYDNALLSSYLAILKSALAFWSFPCACLALFFWNRKNTQAYIAEEEKNAKEI